MENLILALVLLSVILSAAGFWAALVALRGGRRPGGMCPNTYPGPEAKCCRLGIRDAMRSRFAVTGDCPDVPAGHAAVRPVL